MKFRGAFSFRASRRLLAMGGAVLCIPSILNGAELFSEGFDGGETVKMERILGSGMTVEYVDYGNLETGALVHDIPEAPRRVPGSAPRRGALMKADYTPTFENRTGNLAALDSPGGNRLELADNFRLTFDFYLRQSPDVTLNAGGIPTNTGTTEQVLWAVGYTSFSPAGRNWRSTRGSGAWGWLTAEGGFGPSNGADASLYRGTELVGGRDMNATTTPVPFFTEAFGADASPVPHCPANQWVEATITALAGRVTVEYRGAGRVATRFFDREPAAPPGELLGTVMVGYEDSGATASFDPDNQWLLLDNVVVESLPPPTLTVTQTSPFVTWTGAPQAATLRLANTRSQGTLTVGKAVFGGPDAAAFSVSTPLPLAIPAGGAADLEMVFHPVNGPDGIKTASLTIESDDPEEPAYFIPSIRVRRGGGGFLMAHYRLDETSGTALTDVSGSAPAVPGRLETAGREPVTFANPGLLGAAAGGTCVGFLPAQTSTTGNFITTPVTNTPSFTFSFWIRPRDTGLDRALFQRDSAFTGTQDKICALILSADNSLHYRVAGNTVLSADAAPLNNGEIYHVAVTHLDEDGFGNSNATRSRIYINGALAAEASGVEGLGFEDYPLNAAVSTLHIGSRVSAGSGFLGEMDDIQIYGVELTPAQIAGLFNNPGSVATAAPPPAEEFNVTSARFTAAGALAVEFSSGPEFTYTLLRSENLTTWNPVVENVPGTANASVTVLEDPAPPAGRQYYRVHRNPK